MKLLPSRGLLITTLLVAVWLPSAATGVLAFEVREATERETRPLPFAVTNSEWVPLRQNADGVLQERLEQAVKARPSWAELIRKRKLALAVVDLSDPTHVRFAAINGDETLYAASLPKIAILLATVQSFEDGTLEESPGVLEDLVSMIRVSSNPAATRLIDRLGMERIQSVLKDPRYRLYDEAHNGGLWVGKRYAKAGRRAPDPLHGISHAATATQVARFYYLLATGRLVSTERSLQMLEVLSKPGLNHKFVPAIRKRSPKARMHRKSGTWRQWHSDSALVLDDEWRRYILVALVESDNGEQILRSLPPVVETVLREGQTEPSE